MKKNLVYYSVGGHRDYSLMLKLSIQSIINNNSNDYDILIITDEKYKDDYLSDINHDIIKYCILQQTEDPNHIAFNRVKIFQYENIFDYDKTLYLKHYIWIVIL